LVEKLMRTDPAQRMIAEEALEKEPYVNDLVLGKAEARAVLMRAVAIALAPS